MGLEVEKGEKKSIPIGISDFKEFNESNYYYVDKSILIKNILDNRCKVTLFTRPRRFGKTLNLSMLKYYFEKTETDNSYLFEGLEIWKAGEKYKNQQGKYPVINLTFKGAKMNNWEQTYAELTRTIGEEYERHSYLLKANIFSVEEEKKVFENICARKAKFTDYTASIKNLCKYLEKYYKQKPIILIDEYDVPLQNSYIYGFYDETINFVRAALQDALKDNQYLEIGILTGCLRVSKESIFTGLNNLEMVSILNKQYAECFGFTQEEVDEILKYYDIEERREEIKEWYDGYKFGRKDIYNPWSILKYIDDVKNNSRKQPEAYWANTSGNDIVKKLIRNADEVTKNEVEMLINGGTIEKMLNANITYNELDESTNNVWSMLFFTGYLTHVKERREEGDVISYYELKIPNKELLFIYKAIVKGWFEEKVKEQDFSKLYKDIVNGNENDLKVEINRFLLENISVYDSYESFYHGLLIGILSRMKGYKIHSNVESGYGRSDIMLEPVGTNTAAIVIEVKRTKNRKELEKKCEEALKQIETNKYIEKLEQEGYDDIIKYGITFFKKRCLAKKAP